MNDKEKRFVLSESNSLGDIGITLSKEFREKYNINKNNIYKNNINNNNNNSFYDDMHDFRKDIIE